jgi:hypothetical protein
MFATWFDWDTVASYLFILIMWGLEQEQAGSFTRGFIEVISNRVSQLVQIDSYLIHIIPPNIA